MRPERWGSCARMGRRRKACSLSRDLVKVNSWPGYPENFPGCLKLVHVLPPKVRESHRPLTPTLRNSRAIHLPFLSRCFCKHALDLAGSSAYTAHLHHDKLPILLRDASAEALAGKGSFEPTPKLTMNESLQSWGRLSNRYPRKGSRVSFPNVKHWASKDSSLS